MATRLLRKPAGPVAKLFKRGLAVRVKYMDIHVGFAQQLLGRILHLKCGPTMPKGEEVLVVEVRHIRSS